VTEREGKREDRVIKRIHLERVLTMLQLQQSICVKCFSENSTRNSVNRYKQNLAGFLVSATVISFMRTTTHFSSKLRCTRYNYETFPAREENLNFKLLSINTKQPQNNLPPSQTLKATEN